MSDPAESAGAADGVSVQAENSPPPSPPDETPVPDGPQQAEEKPGTQTRHAPRKASPSKPRPTIIARYGLMRNIGEFRHNLKTPPSRNTHVVLRTERGVELGEVVAPVCPPGDCTSHGCGFVTRDRLKEFAAANGAEWPFRRDGRVLRPANPQDVIDYRHLQQSAREASAFCRQQIRDLGLEMKLVTVEHLLGGERIVFYFAAEHRVDFRELVRCLASQYRTRIEMRQVGARDEARLVADYERCGQQCCCQRFLKYLKPVSMRMAKMQKATLDPSKISGRCGRLMCCLRYEDETYDVLRKNLPRKNTWVRTEDVTGRVVDTQIITQLVLLQLVDGTRTAVGMEAIVERNVTPPPPPGSNGASSRRETGKRNDKGRGARGKDDRAAKSRGAHRRREASRRSPDGDQPAGALAGEEAGPPTAAKAPAETAGDPSSGKEDGSSKKKQRGRRSRRKKTSGARGAAAGPGRTRDRSDTTPAGGGSQGLAEPSGQAQAPQNDGGGAADSASPGEAGKGGKSSSKRRRRRKRSKRRRPK